MPDTHNLDEINASRASGVWAKRRRAAERRSAIPALQARRRRRERACRTSGEENKARLTAASPRGPARQPNPAAARAVPPPWPPMIPGPSRRRRVRVRRLGETEGPPLRRDASPRAGPGSPDKPDGTTLSRRGFSDGDKDRRLGSRDGGAASRPSGRGVLACRPVS